MDISNTRHTLGSFALVMLTVGSLSVGLHDPIGNAELRHPRAALRRVRGGDDFFCQSLRARSPRDRAADQPEADQRNPFE